nr:hypothetical protein CFP56_34823 [Quercus suber]
MPESLRCGVQEEETAYDVPRLKRAPPSGRICRAKVHSAVLQSPAWLSFRRSWIAVDDRVSQPTFCSDSCTFQLSLSTASVKDCMV